MNPFGANVTARGIDNADNLALGASMVMVPPNSNIGNDGEGTCSFYDASSNAVFQLSPGLGPDIPNSGSTWTSSKFIGWDVGGGRMVGDYKHNNLNTTAEHFNPLYWIVSPLNQAGLELPYHRNTSQNEDTWVRRVNERGWAVGSVKEDGHTTAGGGSRYAAVWVPTSAYSGVIQSGHEFDNYILLLLASVDQKFIAYGINDKLPPTIVGDYGVLGTAHRCAEASELGYYTGRGHFRRWMDCRQCGRHHRWNNHIPRRPASPPPAPPPTSLLLVR